MYYVISDLHGEYNKFLDMLKLINFQDTDTMWILGDIIDRGEKSLEILEYVMCHKNIHLLKGNHEQMYIDSYLNNDTALWFYNGGSTTWKQLMTKELSYQDSMYNYLSKLPLYHIHDNFILSHAGLYYPENYNNLSLRDFLDIQEEDTLLWSRDNINNEKQFKDYISIVGHTPTPSITNIPKQNIIHTKGTIYIDCGATFKQGKLACLRLDDLKEFYVGDDNYVV